MNSDLCKVFVGGIPWETTEDRLKDYFRSFGTVVEAVIMKDRTTGRARGFGFVEFSDPSVVEKVLLEKHTIDGRTVEVKKAVRREEQHNTSRSNINSSNSPSSANAGRTKKIFVGGLPSSVSEEDFRNYFGQFGTITDVVVMYDHTTQRPRGFGFITFDSEDAVENAMQKNFHELHDKMVEVKRAVPKELSSGRTGGNIGPGRSSPYGGYGQANSTSPVHAYGGPHYGPVSGRGGFSPYAPPYGAMAYGPNIGYGMAMNGGYVGTSYGGGPGFPASGAYAMGYGGPSPTGYIGMPAIYGAASPGYGGASAGPRSPWGHGGSGYGGAGSPAAYGAGGMNAYGSAAWTPAAGGQSPGNAVPYNNGSHGYGTTNDVGYTTYGDSSWKSSEHGSPAAPSPSGSGGAPDGGYSVTGRQGQRGPEARFRPYPATGERVV